MYGESNTTGEKKEKENPDDEYRKFGPLQGPGYSEKTVDLKTRLEKKYKQMLGLAQVRQFLKEKGTMAEIHKIESNGSLFDSGDSITTIVGMFSNSENKLYVVGNGKEYKVINMTDAEKLLANHKCNSDCLGDRKQLEKLVSGDKYNKWLCTDIFGLL